MARLDRWLMLTDGLKRPGRTTRPITPISSSAKHRVFNTSTPGDVGVGTPSTYTDGTPSIKLGSFFYTLSSSSPSTTGWRMVGGRIYVPTGSALIGKPITIFGYKTTTQSVDLALTPDRTNNLASAVAGWNEVLWTPLVVTPGSAGNFMFIGYEVTGAGAGYYVHTPSFGAQNIYAVDGSPLVMNEDVNRSFFKIGSNATNTNSAWYGTDVVVDEG